jgi:diaminopimelate decarboxylase
MQIYEPDRDRHHFTREHGVLSWDGCSLETAAHVFGTPLYVASDRALEEGLAGVRAAFAAAGIDVAVHFSCKTNPLVHTLRTLTDLGCGLEVVADHELELARELGIEGERLIVNGTVKSTRMLEEAVEMRAALINVESLEELERVAEAGESLGERVNVGGDAESFRHDALDVGAALTDRLRPWV